ncbi:epoxide hydrolase family protein [Glaciibacter superstes]|uniref:epoxide hydrolase family protein n=1 Tax=Glaciibacter superstes TaxID=501023 RepID=UPI0003B6BE31|nr:epoxide hydrolase family protein [Glaciibacter superstes]
MTLTPFRIRLDGGILVDLDERVARSRFTPPSDPTPWKAGADPAYLRGLVDYWRDSFDWRSREQWLNSYPQFIAHTDAGDLHFVHLRAVSGGEAQPPILLAHGWPSSFIEMLQLADRLTDPARFGGDPADACDVVIPSLPGFLFSTLPSGPLTRESMARILHQLMTEELGYERYGAFGGDIGGTVVAWLGALYSEQVAGIHMIHPPFPADFDARPLHQDEEAFLAAEESYDERDGGYSAIMITRPDTIAPALNDSPVGLAAWIVDKLRDWSDCDGDLATRFDFDTILTTVTLYWATGSIGSSMRQYYDHAHNPPRPPIHVPAAFTLSNEPGMVGFPRSIAERACTNIVSWSLPGRGGHFMAHEEPDQVASALNAKFSGR